MEKQTKLQKHTKRPSILMKKNYALIKYIQFTFNFVTFYKYAKANTVKKKTTQCFSITLSHQIIYPISTSFKLYKQL